MRRYRPLFVSDPRNLARESSKVVDVFVAQAVNDRPIDVLVGMDGDVSEADRSLHLLYEPVIDHVELGERIECTAHRIWGRKGGAGNHDRRDIDADLDRTRQVECDDVLEVWIRCELRRLLWAAALDPFDAATQGLELFVD